MAGLWAQPQAPLPRMGGLQRMRHKGLQLPRLEVPAVTHSPGGPLGNLQSGKKTKGQRLGQRKGIWGGGRQAEAGSGACPKLHCASLDNLEMQEGGC